MDKKSMKEDAKQARWAYETLAGMLKWRRLDGTPIPTWNELSLNAQWKCGSVVDVLLHYVHKSKFDNK